MIGRGYRHLTSNTPINAIDDLPGVKIRRGQSKPFIHPFSPLGAIIIPNSHSPSYFSCCSASASFSRPAGHFSQIYTFKLQEAQESLAIIGHLFTT